MLNTKYVKLEDIPADKRGAYVEKDGGYVLDELATDHPVVVNEKSLKSEKTAALARATSLQNQVTELSTKTVPEGHVVVPVADKQLLDAVKPLGTLEEIKSKVIEFPTLKEKAEAVEREQKLTGVAQVLGYNPTVFSKLPGLPAPDTFEVRDRTENGQVVKNRAGEPEKVVIVKLTENGQTVERNWTDYFNANEALKVFEPALKVAPGGGGAASGGRQMPAQTGGAASGADDPIAERLAARKDQRGKQPNALMTTLTPVAVGGDAKQTGANP